MRIVNIVFLFLSMFIATDVSASHVKGCANCILRIRLHVGGCANRVLHIPRTPNLSQTFLTNDEITLLQEDERNIVAGRGLFLAIMENLSRQVTHEDMQKIMTGSAVRHTYEQIASDINQFADSHHREFTISFDDSEAICTNDPNNCKKCAEITENMVPLSLGGKIGLSDSLDDSEAICTNDPDNCEKCAKITKNMVPLSPCEKIRLPDDTFKIYARWYRKDDGGLAWRVDIIE